MILIMLSVLSVTQAMPNTGGIDLSVNVDKNKMNFYPGIGGLGKGISAGIDFYLNKTVLCSSDVDGSTGFCTSDAECSYGKGRAIGSCDLGGVCCKVESSCASTSDFPVTYFQNPAYPQADTDDVSCNFNIEVSKKVCQLRVDFEDFEIPGPDLSGVCLNTNNFKIYAASSPSGILGGTSQSGLCGINRGQHLYVSVQPGDVVQMHFTLSGIGAVPAATFISLNSDLQYKWNLKVTQVECSSDDTGMAALEAPSGCLQYFRGNFGTMSSFGMDGTNAFAPDQNYYICIAQDADDRRNACGIDLRAVMFGMPVAEAACQPGDLPVGGAAECCTADPADASIGINSVVSLGAGAVAAVGNPRFRYCGLSLGGTTNQIVNDHPSPYMIHVRSGVGRIARTGVPPVSAPPNIDIGFQLNYKIITGSC